MTRATPGQPSPSTPAPQIDLDPLMPDATAAKAEDVGVKKADTAAPVTLDDIIGGTVLVGAVYWLAHLRDIR